MSVFLLRWRCRSSVGMLIMRSVRQLVCVTYSRVVVQALSTHLGFFCRIDTTNTVVVCTAEARGEYPPDSRVFESCSEIRHIDQVSQRLLHHQAGASHSVRSACRGHQRVPARKMDDSSCWLIVLVREAVAKTILIDWQGINFHRLPLFTARWVLRPPSEGLSLGHRDSQCWSPWC
jgi:hypothetical protein